MKLKRIWKLIILNSIQRRFLRFPILWYTYGPLAAFGNSFIPLGNAAHKTASAMNDLAESLNQLKPSS